MVALTFKSHQQLQMRTMETFLVYALASALFIVLVAALLRVWSMFELNEQNGNQIQPIPDDAIRFIA